MLRDLLRTLAIGTLVLCFTAQFGLAVVIATHNDMTFDGTDEDPNFPGLQYFAGDPAPPDFDDSRTAGGNQFGALIGPWPDSGPGAGIAVHVDVANSVPPGTLEIGDSLRVSLWLASDASDPLDPPNIDVLKFELWEQPLGNPDIAEELPFRTLDTERDAVDNFGGMLPSGQPIANRYVSAPPAGQGPVTETEWRQFSYEYIIVQDDLNLANASDISAVQEIRPVLFLGGFGGGQDGAGTLLMDRVIVEWFDDNATMLATPLDTTNPGPLLPTLGDMDCDGDVDFDDIDPFVLGLQDPDEYEAIFGLPPEAKGDTDGDGDLDFDDIDGFVEILQPSAVEGVPEPASVVMVCAGLICVFPFIWKWTRTRFR